MEDESQELKFVCKMCDKRHPCRKSLGEHVRSHIVVNSADSDEKAEVHWKKIGSLLLNEPKTEESVNAHSSYVLREHPRKSWRAVAAGFTLQQERVCRQCGKNFQSLKALCGHMACHSDRYRGIKGDQSWNSDTQKLEMDSHSETEEVSKRIIRTRSFKSSKCLSFSLANNGYSSSVSEIDGDEQEEVALCLMMLSRDSTFRGVLNSVESSDNNSVILESRKVNAVVKNSTLTEWESETAQTNDSDSGYFLDECGKANYTLSITSQRKSSGYSHLTRSREGSQKRRQYECFNCKKVFKSYQALGGHRPCHQRSNEYCEHSSKSSHHISTQLTTNAKPGGKTLYEAKSKAKKSKGHACPFCDRVFRNGQALGGHKRSHFLAGHRNSGNRSPGARPSWLDLNLPTQCS